MSVRTAEATWNGTLKEGNGTAKGASGHFEVPYTWASRFSDGVGTNPEELIGAAHAGCYSMFLSALLTNAGYTPTSIHTVASVHLEAGPTVTKIELVTAASVPNLSEADLQTFAADAKAKCPISKALAAVAEITLEATLV
ncbi:MAG: OsmC family peroxiredoxin [Caldilineaceae bacterium]